MLDGFRGHGESRGVGIGVPGIIDMDTGMLRESPNLPGWSEFPVHAEIERRLGIPVMLENDANAAALGEKWLGAAKDYGSMCMLTLGTGVGGGIVLDGKIWHGMNGMAGELGHINVEPDGHPCNCGSRGCVEQYASATAVVRMAREAVAKNLSKALARAAEGEDFNSLHVYKLAEQGDAAAQNIFRRMGRALGVVLADMVNASQLADLRNRRRGRQRMGRICAHHDGGNSEALVCLRGDRAGNSTVGESEQEHTNHQGLTGQRCRPLRCRILAVATCRSKVICPEWDKRSEG